VSSLLGRAEVDGDESAVSTPAAAGAARAERDDVEVDTANDARRKEELDGNFIRNNNHSSRR
jgi:hypothetical protein